MIMATPPNAICVLKSELGACCLSIASSAGTLPSA
jgi:hypothetical protein